MVYGTMILYKGLTICINDPPRIIHSIEVVLPRGKVCKTRLGNGWNSATFSRIAIMHKNTTPY